MTSQALQEKLAKILDSAMRMAGADFGTVQVFNPERDGLEIVASRGFGETFLNTFSLVKRDDPSACGRALRLARRVMVSDVTTDPYYAPYLSIARRIGYRAVHCTPILGADKQALGVLCLHFAEAHRLPRSTARYLESCALEIERLLETL